MRELIFTPELARRVDFNERKYAVRDEQGRFLGYFTPSVFSPEDLEEAEKALDSDEPCYTTQEVLSYLQSLE